MYQIVKFLFPFANDFDKAKPRPSLVISPSFGKHKQTVLAYITTNSKDILETDIILDPKTIPNFSSTGLNSLSVVKPHRLITTTPPQIGEVIGVLPDEIIPELKEKLIKILKL
ncbi:MAG TPA: type II toxin-antitoxin system PemK/MazF family toxin [Candidatus Saccharimonadales bacterium]|nr:type II toxin-antitoxin system PemK/MazF family toxin [Candidatus Saccharimonadales bacterium]